MLTGPATYRVQNAQYKANKLLKAANNERAAAESQLQRFSQMLGNRRRMEAAGDAIGKVNSNIAKNIDAKANNDIQQQISLAEELGASATMASAAGVGGSTMQAYNSTVRLRAAMGQEQGDRAFASDLYAANLDKGNILTEAVAGLDNNNYRANLDYREFVKPHKQSALSMIAEVGLTAAATYFGGPQAGQAVMSVFDADQQMQNGDFAGAAASFDHGISSAVGGFNDTRSMGGSYWSKPKPTNLPFIPH